MRPRRVPKKRESAATSNQEPGTLHDVFEGIAPGEGKEIAKGMWAMDIVMLALDPPEPIKKSLKRKPSRRTK